MTWRAYIEDTAEGWMSNTVRLLVARQYDDGRTEVVNGDGTMTMVEPGVRVGPGFEIPRDAVQAVAEAIEKWQGDSSHAATEARVLREWLAEERRRVDGFISTALGVVA